MADFTKLHGYDVKDSVARSQLSSQEQSIETLEKLYDTQEIDSSMISGNLYFESGAGYSSNVINIDISSINENYKYINLVHLTKSLGVVTKLLLPQNGGITLSEQFPCFAQTTSTTKFEQYYGSIAFEVSRNNNTLSIKAFNTPFHVVINLSGGVETSREYLIDKNGSMIVSGGLAGFYTEFSGFYLSNI